MQVELFRQTGSKLKPEKRPLIVALQSWNRTVVTREKLPYDKIPADKHLAAALLGGRVIDECMQTRATPQPWPWEGRGYFTIDLKGGTIIRCTDCGFETDNISQSHPLGREAIVNTKRNKSEPITNDVGWDPEKGQLVADNRPGILAIIFKRGTLLTLNRLDAAFPDWNVFVDTPTTYAIAYRLAEEATTTQDDSHAP